MARRKKKVTVEVSKRNYNRFVCRTHSKARVLQLAGFTIGPPYMRAPSEEESNRGIVEVRMPANDAAAATYAIIDGETFLLENIQLIRKAPKTYWYEESPRSTAEAEAA